MDGVEKELLTDVVGLMAPLIGLCLKTMGIHQPVHPGVNGDQQSGAGVGRGRSWQGRPRFHRVRCLVSSQVQLSSAGSLNTVVQSEISLLPSWRFGSAPERRSQRSQPFLLLCNAAHRDTSVLRTVCVSLVHVVGIDRVHFGFFDCLFYLTGMMSSQHIGTI